MRVDPTFPGRQGESLQSIRSALGRLGERAGIARVLTATATLDFPSISVNSCEDLTVTVTGAKTGDAVYLGPPSNLETGLIAVGFVSSSDTVTVRVCNTSGGANNPASNDWRILVVGV